ncbi:hypothetical protein [Actinomadura decatromicini]|uniref:hypothetical protein n=1 Tax=Actinomadura decatromicini TaxID=2604572 RepID=UPI001652D6C4|nr:hypothetical protein [Actinomadura decatromicini]
MVADPHEGLDPSEETPDTGESSDGDGIKRRTFVTGTAAAGAVAAAAAVLPAVAADPVAAAEKRADTAAIPGSKHFATMLAFGDFELSEEGKLLFTKPAVVEAPKTPDDPVVIACAGIQGLSGVTTERKVLATKNGRPRVGLTRILTHFQWENPKVLIEQNPYKNSWGELVGNGTGGIGKLLPGRATFYQYLILTAFDRPLINAKPMVMTAEDVKQWPPIGSHFKTEGPTDFYDLSSLTRPGDMASEVAPDSPVIATLAACQTIVMTQVFMPSIPG